MLLKLSTVTRILFGKTGERQFNTKPVSFSTSASSRYILHSGSREVPKRWAKRMVARRPAESCRMENNSAVVEEAFESPTPMLSSTAREESKLAMLLEKAWRESYSVRSEKAVQGRIVDHGRT